MLQEQAVAPHTLGLLKRLSPELARHGFYLAGGTALALRLGHRLSIDLDFFSAQKFNPPSMADALENFLDQPPRILQQSTGSIALMIEETKIELLHYPYPLLSPLETQGGITLASLPDNVSMKLSALAGRGSKKDFTDIAAVLQQIDLETMLSWYQQKFPNSEVFMLMKSLTWFEDAEQEPDPLFLQKQSWPEIKTRVIASLAI
ncbi:MAG: nucleotidyl transferase AbiEii/AbiGii toxin family protein [Verrucomicrobia bacterium]|nr:nucleotidyl transferase AbiEii/AbiGii toxin family protein [Verrucomicrobiota bacterium]